MQAFQLPRYYRQRNTDAIYASQTVLNALWVCRMCHRSACVIQSRDTPDQSHEGRLQSARLAPASSPDQMRDPFLLLSVPLPDQLAWSSAVSAFGFLLWHVLPRQQGSWPSPAQQRFLNLLVTFVLLRLALPTFHQSMDSQQSHQSKRIIHTLVMSVCMLRFSMQASCWQTMHK